MFPRAPNAREVSKLREFKTVDIARRLCVISPTMVRLRNYSVYTLNPLSIFNPSLLIKGDEVWVYARVILGYYKYVSAIAKISIPLSEILEGKCSVSQYSADIVIYPSTKYDVWGAEDPRVTEILGRPYMVYTGRSVNYFNPGVSRERTLPVVAVSVDRHGFKWSKISVPVMPPEVRPRVISDKNAFPLLTTSGEVLFFHRPHIGKDFYLAVSRAGKELLRGGDGVREVQLGGTKVVMEPASFEVKLGWSTPLVEVGGDTYVAIVHGIDREMEVYRALAVLVKYDRDLGIRAVSVTPHYIMEPRESFEIFGDRPYVVYPCGLAKVDENLVVSYGAADYAVGLAEIGLDHLMSILDKFRVE